jgi:hypothetical protein
MARKINLEIVRGSDFYHEFEVSGDGGLLDLSGYQANAWSSKHEESNSSFEFTTNTYSNGVISMSLDKSFTAELENGDRMWWLKVTLLTSNASSFPFEGRVRVKGRPNP